MSASAIWYMLSSLPSALSALTAQSTNRQLSVVYPAPGRIWSMLGEKTRGSCFLRPSENGMPVSSHFPVQRSFAQVSVKPKGCPRFAQRLLLEYSKAFQGSSMRIFWNCLSIKAWKAAGLFSAQEFRDFLRRNRNSSLEAHLSRHLARSRFLPSTLQDVRQNICRGPAGTNSALHVRQILGACVTKCMLPLCEYTGIMPLSEGQV